MSIRNRHSIEMVYLEFALKMAKESPSKKFGFFRAWTDPSTVLHMFAGQMALKNTSILNADYSTA